MLTSKEKPWEEMVTSRAMLTYYCSTLDAVYKDCQKRVESIVYCMDFSELYVYLHRWRSGYVQFQLFDYIFEEPSEDCRITITPPHVLELLRYLGGLANTLDQYKDYKTLLGSWRVSQFAKYLEEKKNEPIKPHELMARYKHLGSFAPLILFADARGYEILIKNPLMRFLRLVDGGILKPIYEVLRTKSIPVNSGIYETLLDQLARERAQKSINNQVDALAGAIVYGICERYYGRKEFYSTLVTHSPTPFKVLDRYTKFPEDTGGMSLVRQPLYLMAKKLCKEKYGDRDECSFVLSRLVPMFWRLHDSPNARALSDAIVEDLNREYNDNRYSFRAKAFRDLHFLTKMFFYDVDWESYFAKTISKLVENDIISKELSKALDSNNKVVADQLSNTPLADISIMKDVLENLRSYCDSIEDAQEELRKDVKDLYAKIKDFVGSKDSGAFTADMLEFFETTGSHF